MPAIMIRDDLDAIAAWLVTQETADYGYGSCEYDHVGAEKHIQALLSEVDRLRDIVAKATKPAR